MCDVRRGIPGTWDDGVEASMMNGGRYLYPESVPGYFPSDYERGGVAGCNRGCAAFCQWFECEEKAEVLTRQRRGLDYPWRVQAWCAAHAGEVELEVIPRVVA